MCGPQTLRRSAFLQATSLVARRKETFLSRQQRKERREVEATQAVQIVILVSSYSESYASSFLGTPPHLPPLHWISAKNLVKTKILISLEGKILSEGIFGFLGRAVFQSERIIEQSRIRLTEVFYFYSG